MKNKSKEKKYKNFVIKDTGRYGNGVFARKNFKKGEIIKVFRGEEISFDECIKRIKKGTEKQSDSLQIDLEIDLDLDELSNSFNHSCDPNSLHRKKCELVAIKDIKVGEEITYDYSATIGPNIPKSLWTMRCKCGSEKCRKIIGNVLTISPVILKKYQQLGLLQDYIKKELNLIKKRNGSIPKYKKIVI